MKTWRVPWLPVVLMIVTFLGAIWLAAPNFTISRTVSFSPTNEGPATAEDLQPREMQIECRANGDYYPGSNGNSAFFMSASPPDATSFCDEARSDRKNRAVVVGVIGLVAAVGLVVASRVSRKGLAKSAVRRPSPPVEQ